MGNLCSSPQAKEPVPPNPKGKPDTALLKDDSAMQAVGLEGDSALARNEQASSSSAAPVLPITVPAALNEEDDESRGDNLQPASLPTKGGTERSANDWSEEDATGRSAGPNPLEHQSSKAIMMDALEKPHNRSDSIMSGIVAPPADATHQRPDEAGGAEGEAEAEADIGVVGVWDPGGLAGRGGDEDAGVKETGAVVDTAYKSDEVEAYDENGTLLIRNGLGQVINSDTGELVPPTMERYSAEGDPLDEFNRPLVGERAEDTFWEAGDGGGGAKNGVEGTGQDEEGGGAPEEQGESQLETLLYDIGARKRRAEGVEMLEVAAPEEEEASPGRRLPGERARALTSTAQKRLEAAQAGFRPRSPSPGRGQIEGLDENGEPIYVSTRHRARDLSISGQFVSTLEMQIINNMVTYAEGEEYILPIQLSNLWRDAGEKNEALISDMLEDLMHLQQDDGFWSISTLAKYLAETPSKLETYTTEQRDIADYMSSFCASDHWASERELKTMWITNGRMSEKEVDGLFDMLDQSFRTDVHGRYSLHDLAVVFSLPALEKELTV